MLHPMTDELTEDERAVLADPETKAAVERARQSTVRVPRRRPDGDGR